MILDKLYGNAQLIEDYKIALDDGRAHGLIVDLASDTSEGFGPTSLELCVMSHAGCYATIFALTAVKMRVPLKGLKVKVVAIKTDATGTITEETFDITVETTAPVDRIKRCHVLTLRCPVGIIFKKAGIKLTYKLNGEIVKGE
jgi:uncharacterized OsmC-like protein